MIPVKCNSLERKGEEEKQAREGGSGRNKHNSYRSKAYGGKQHLEEKKNVELKSNSVMLGK